MATGTQKLNAHGFPLRWALDAPSPQATNPSNTTTGSTNADAVITIPADTGQGQAEGEGNGPAGGSTSRPIVIPQLGWSYWAAPTAGTLVTLKDGANVIYQELITAANLAALRTFTPPLRGTKGNAIVATASNGGQTATVTVPNPYVLAE